MLLDLRRCSGWSKNEAFKCKKIPRLKCKYIFKKASVGERNTDSIKHTTYLINRCPPPQPKAPSLRLKLKEEERKSVSLFFLPKPENL